MVTGPGVNQGKTAFLEKFLPGNKDADLAAINQAWKATGKDDTLSESLVSKTRSRLKLPKKRAPRGGAAAAPKTTGKSKSSPKGAATKQAAKAQGAPARANGREGGTGPRKLEFIRELLGKDNSLGAEAVRRAWMKAGNEGSISENSYYSAKREMGLTARRSPGESASPVASPPEAGPPASEMADVPQRSGGRDAAASTSMVAAGASIGNRDRLVDEVEAGIDDLIFTLKTNGGMPEVEAALRATRRLLTRSNGG